MQNLLRWAILQLIGLFYPRIEVQGRENLPAGPAIFVLNHPNGLLDPLVLMAGIGRHVHFLAKSTFFSSPLSRLAMESFGALPAYRQHDAGMDSSARADRNEQTFARCRELLREGQALALFPEGTTHSQPELLPLRTGAARIALSAEAEAGWQLQLPIVPVGLWYQNKSRFRSAVLLRIGEPFGLDDYAASYASEPRRMVGQLTERIDARLDEVVLQAESNDVLKGLPFLAAWTAPAAPETMQQQHTRTAELLGAYKLLRSRDPVRIEEITQRAWSYARALQTFGIADPWTLELPEARRQRAAWLLLLVTIGFLPALAGFALSYGPYRLARPLTLRMVGKYEEIVGTGKLIAGTVLVLLGWLIEALICGALFGWLAGLILFIAAPLLGYCALRWGEIWYELRQIAGYQWLRLRHRALVHALIDRRQALADEVMVALRGAQGTPEGL